jgi:uncharacterized membrane protein
MAMRFLRLFCLALSVLAAALIAGFFYAYHCSVMPGLAATDAVSAIKAMQGINAVVRNAVFAFSFFGTLAFGGIATLLLIGAGNWPLAPELLRDNIMPYYFLPTESMAGAIQCLFYVLTMVTATLTFLVARSS